MENGFFTVDYESMAGVATALVAYNILARSVRRSKVMTFTFVTPFGAQYDDVVTHSSKSPFA
ncbi:hypothetical protein ACLK1Z_24025 [Escherichia coli]